MCVTTVERTVGLIREAAGGAEAPEVLAGEPVDPIVSDLQRLVLEPWDPVDLRGTVRVALSTARRTQGDA